MLAIAKDTWVAKVWNQDGERGCWNPRFSRQLHDWELEEVEAFLKQLQSQTIDSEIEDKMVWQIRKDGFF